MYWFYEWCNIGLNKKYIKNEKENKSKFIIFDGICKSLLIVVMVELKIGLMLLLLWEWCGLFGWYRLIRWWFWWWREKNEWCFMVMLVVVVVVERLWLWFWLLGWLGMCLLIIWGLEDEKEFLISCCWWWWWWDFVVILF